MNWQLPREIQHLNPAWLIMLALATAFIPLGFAPVVWAQSVAAQVSSETGYVGSPLVYRIVIADAEEFEILLPDKMDGLKFEQTGPPSRQSSVMIFNGRRTESHTIIANYLVFPERAGELEIPPIPIMVGGKEYQTQPKSLLIRESINDGKLLVEVNCDTDKAYVGQSLRVTLRILMKPYEDEGFDVKLDAPTSWRLISKYSNWGMFKEVYENFSRSRRLPRMRTVSRTGPGGEDEEFYAFELEQDYYPNRPGKIDGGKVKIIANYPLSLKRTRGSMFMDNEFDDLLRDFDDLFPGRTRLKIENTRPLVAQAELGTTEVLPIPVSGRPATYRGAVGRYRMTAESKTRRVNAGDPITLWLVVTGNGPMDLLQAPPLAEIESLTKDFIVTDQALAGYVENGIKYFKTEIRPRRSDVSEIPPIPLSFFDPESEQFQTVFTDPIPIDVSEAEQLDLSAQVPQAKSNPAISPTDDELVPNRELVTAPPGSPLPLTWWVVMLAPPCLVLATALVQLVATMGKHGFRQGPSVENTRVQIENASALDEIGSVLGRYIGSKFSASTDSLLQSIGTLRLNGLSDSAKSIEPLQVLIERNQLARPTTEVLAQAKQLAIDSLLLVENEAKQKGHLNRQQVTPAMSRNAACLLAFALVNPTVVSPPEVVLSAKQQQQVFAEALGLYFEAEQAEPNENSSAVDKIDNKYQIAADKFQLLVDSGIQSPSLYFNQGLASWKAGQIGRARMSVLRGLLLSRSDSNLLRLQRELDGQLNDPSGSTQILNSIYPWLSHSFWAWSSGIILLLFWSLIFVRQWGLFSFSRCWLLPPLLAGALTLGVLFLEYRNTSRWKSSAVAMVDSLAIRNGDSDAAELLSTQEGVEGKLVQLIHERNGWFKIRFETEGNSASDIVGWVPTDVIEPLVPRKD